MFPDWDERFGILSNSLVMLSIVIPTYNSEGCIGVALSSILSQSYVDWEVLVMDGGSVDSTVSIANSFHDDRIRVFSEPDHGVYEAMNKGIDLSQGAWLYFLGSDDYLLHNHVLESVFTPTIDADILYGDVESPHLKKEYSGKWQVSHIMYNRCHQGIFYKKWLFDRYGRYELKYRVLADRAFNLKVFFNRNVKVLYLPVKIAHYSSGGLSSTLTDTVFLQDFSSIVLENLYWRLSNSQKIYFINDYLKWSGNTKYRRLFVCVLSIIRAEKKCKSVIKNLIGIYAANRT